MGKRPLERSLSASSCIDEAETTAKVVHRGVVSPTATRSKTIRCLLPPHKPLSFVCQHDFEMHHQQQHSNRCLECRKNFPTDHFLDLHIAENHDPFVKARQACEEKTYACFVEGCDKICLTWKKRRSHLVDKHGFPRNYDFFLVNDGVDRRHSMLRSDRKRKPRIPRDDSKIKPNDSVKGEEVGTPVNARDAADNELTRTNEERSSENEDDDSSQDDVGSASDDQEGETDRASVPASRTTSQSTSDALLTPSTSSNGIGAARKEVDDLTKSMSALKFVPRSLRFGRGRGKGGLARQ